MRLKGLPSAMVVFLFVSCSATALSDSETSENSVSLSDTPLFDYRYTQVAEDLGILQDGASESKLDYGSIETANLTPMDPPKKTNACRLTIKEADFDTTDFCQMETADTCLDSCGSNCGQIFADTSYDTCGAGCINTTSITCAGCGGQTFGFTCDGCGQTIGDTCDGCGQTFGFTCDGCGQTIGDTCDGCGQTFGFTCDGCGQTFGDTCLDTCGNTCGDTCAGTCLSSCQTCVLSCGAATCSNTCGGTCGVTCSNTCGSTCGLTCGGTCGVTCGGTCGLTCARTCSNTCANTCALTCQRTCAQTCSATCMLTCSPTCSATCQATCGAKCLVPAPAVQQRIDAIATAKYKTTEPPMAEQNALASIDPNSKPPALVYYLGTYIPWAAFLRSFSGNGIYAWIETEGGWDVIAKAPKGTWVREFVFVPSNGNLIAKKIEPNGLGSSANFGPVGAGYKFIWLFAQNSGAYISSFEQAGKKSNNVTLIAY